MDEFGNPTITEIFEPLNKRLFNIGNGDIDPEIGFYTEGEDYYNRKIQAIVHGIFSFKGTLSLRFIDKALSTIDELNAKGDELVKNVKEISEEDFSNDDEEYGSKEGVLNEIKIELAYYRDKLSQLKSQIVKQIPTDNTENIITQNEHELTAGLKMPVASNNSTSRLDRYQAGLLFYFLTEHGGIKRYPANALATFVSYLTGHSENTIRTEVLGNIWDVIKDKKKIRQ